MKKEDNIQIIQALRGLACILVVLCHTSYTHFGAFGVDFFLIISGFIIMYSTEKGAESFWKKRLIKIVPLYWFITLITAVLVYFLPWLFNSYEVSVEYILKSLLFIPYEHSGIRQPLLGLGWTLNYEMLFYFIFWISMKMSYFKRGWISIGFCVLLTAVSNIPDLPMPGAFYSEGYLIEFCYGIIAYELYLRCLKQYREKENYNSKLVTMMFAIGIIISCYLMEQGVNTNGYRIISTGLVGTLLFIVMVTLEKKIFIP